MASKLGETFVPSTFENHLNDPNDLHEVRYVNGYRPSLSIFVRAYKIKLHIFIRSAVETISQTY